MIRIVPDDFLGWHGRTTPVSARLAGAPAISIDEPRRRSPTGEPLSRRRARPGPARRQARTRLANAAAPAGDAVVRGLRGLTRPRRRPLLPVGSL